MIRRLALILWLFPWALLAQTVPAAKAVDIAWSLMGGSHLSLKTHLIQDSVIAIGNTGSPAAWVVTFKPVGFVIVSALETGSPVLGYSLTSGFPANPGHPLLSWLLPQYQSQINMPRQKAGQNSEFSTDHSVLPLTSAKWGQGDPWNHFCPTDSTGKRALVGCVAVAMSQIMEKWQWPPKGYGEVTYTPLQHAEYGQITVNFDTTNYHWENTHDIYPTPAAELILYQTGVASLMNYDPYLSSTSVDRYAVPALINNFLYNRNMVFRKMEGNATSDWIRMLHQELDNSRPVLYAGTSPDGKSSHAFDVDGYRNDTFFHFNWGWNGAGDGWYTLSGMAGGGSDFSSQQGAIFGIQPSTMPLHDRPSSLDVLGGDGFSQLFWEQPVINDFSNFNIYRDGHLIGQTGDTKFRDTALTNGRSYTYRLSAFYNGENPGESISTPDISVSPWIRMLAGYSQSFEAGPAGWQLQNTGSGFRIGSSADFQTGGNQGNIAFIRSEGHPAGEQVSDYLISPVIFPGDFSHAAISFDYAFRQKTGIDNLSLVWRDFNTGKWQTITVLDSTGGYSDWKNLHFYLPLTAVNTPIQIAFYYNDFYGQGFGAAIDNITIYNVAEPAIPKFTMDDADLCLNQTVTFTDQSKGLIESWEWDFGEGAIPRYSTTQGPHQVTYTLSGRKTIKLSLNHLDHIILADGISIRDKPVAAFNYYRKFQDISFVNKSDFAERLLWSFGDGGTSTEADPVHTYYSKNIFQVSMIAYNGSCAPDTATATIDMRSGTGIDEQSALNRLTIYPNPTGGRITLLWDNALPDPLNIKVLSLTGQIFLSGEYPQQKEMILDLFNFPDGLYILQITSGKVIRNQQILKINN